MLPLQLMQVLLCSFRTPVQAQVSIYVKRKEDVVVLTWPETPLRRMPAHPCRVLIELILPRMKLCYRGISDVLFCWTVEASIIADDSESVELERVDG